MTITVASILKASSITKKYVQHESNINLLVFEFPRRALVNRNEKMFCDVLTNVNSPTGKWLSYGGMHIIDIE